MKQPIYNTALYLRLSRDDDNEGDSNSIQTQKSMLEDYARRNGFPNPTHFTDDGISGTRFDRPGFTAMMEEVEAGNVEAIIVKEYCVIIGLTQKGLAKSRVSGLVPSFLA